MTTCKASTDEKAVAKTDELNQPPLNHRMLYEPTTNTLVPVDANFANVLLDDKAQKIQKEEQQQKILRQVAKAKKSKKEREKVRL